MKGWRMLLRWGLFILRGLVGVPLMCLGALMFLLVVATMTISFIMGSYLAIRDGFPNPLQIFVKLGEASYDWFSPAVLRMGAYALLGGLGALIVPKSWPWQN